MDVPRQRGSQPTEAGRAGPLAAGLALLLLGAAANIWFLTHDRSLDLSGDEAHYWEWSRRLDLSYYSKGPLVAYIIAGSRALLADWSRRVVGSEALAVRLPAVLLSILTGLGIYVLALRALRDARVALASLALTFTIPMLAAGSSLMTIDAPLMCCWTWALVVALAALRRDKTRDWIVLGLLIALGTLAKYNMLLLFPAVGLLILTDPQLRRFAARPGPYVATAIGLLGLLPILIWNANHDWVSFRHVAGQAGVSGGSTLDAAGVLTYLVGQAGVIGPLWFVGMIWALIDFARRPVDSAVESHDPQSLRLLIFAAAVPWLVFLAFSPITKIQPNWTAVALAGNAILLAAWLRRRLRLPTAGGRAGGRVFIPLGVLWGVACVVVLHNTQWLTPLFARLAKSAPAWDLTPIAKYDPTARLRGWSELGAAVGEVQARERAAGADPFILTDDYQTASEIAFYTPGNPPVYSAQAALGGRRSQYDIWRNPIRDRDEFVGRPCIYVGAVQRALTEPDGANPPPLPNLRRERTVVHKLEGHPLQIWSISVCDSFAGFKVAADERSTGKY